MANTTNDKQYLQLEIRATVLTQLINAGAIVAADLHALNSNSRAEVRALLLNSLRVMSKR